MKNSVLDIVSRALAALESDATVEQRRDAWNELRDAFFPAHWTIQDCACDECAAQAVQNRHPSPECGDTTCVTCPPESTPSGTGGAE
jgi:hypothetical protein